MKKVILLIIALFTIVGVTRAQSSSNNNQKHFDVDMFNKQKADYIKLNAELTPTEATQFIPLLNELQHKRFELNRAVRNQTRAVKHKVNATDADYQNLIELSLNSDIKEAELKKEYYKKFRLILSPQKIYKCQIAESNFMKNYVNAHRQKRKEKK